MGAGGGFARCVMGVVGVARPRSVAPRRTVVAVRLSAAEVAQVDRLRGQLSRSEWLRWLLLQQRKTN